MSGKTKADLLVEIESLRHQLEVKDDYISTLEDLLDAENRDIKALRASHDAGVKAHVKLHIGHTISEMRRNEKRAFYFKRFLFHHLEKGLNPFKAETEANRDVEKESGEGYGTSTLDGFRHGDELKKYFTKRKRPLQN